MKVVLIGGGRGGGETEKSIGLMSLKGISIVFIESSEIKYTDIYTIWNRVGLINKPSRLWSCSKSHKNTATSRPPELDTDYSPSPHRQSLLSQEIHVSCTGAD